MLPITFATYHSLYPDDSRETFDRCLPLAALQLDSLTAERWRHVPEDGPCAPRIACCLAELTHQELENQQTGAGSGLRIIHNDGYSQHYAVSDQAGLGEQRRAIALGWLSGTGLVSAL